MRTLEDVCDPIVHRVMLLTMGTGLGQITRIAKTEGVGAFYEVGVHLPVTWLGFLHLRVRTLQPGTA